MKRPSILGCWLLWAALGVSSATASGPSLDAWKPAFDPSGATYRCVVSNASHPVLKGVYAGFAMRDAIWERTRGRIYLDFKPFSMLGGEVGVLKQLQMGAIQGMGCSSVAATNLGPRIGILNLPFLLNTPAKLERFVASGELFDHFASSMQHQGIAVLDITGFGAYGWATTRPVRSLADARGLKIRTAEAAINRSIYKAWGIGAVAMPWPDVAVALKQGVIDGLDHTPTVCHITRKFESARYYTQIDYAQGLFVWLFNAAWLNRLPDDLRRTFVQTVHDVCREMRRQAADQEKELIVKARAAGVEFIRLPPQDQATLKRQVESVYGRYARDINQTYPGDRFRGTDYLARVNALGEASGTADPYAGRTEKPAAPPAPAPDTTAPQIVVTSHETDRDLRVPSDRKQTVVEGSVADASGVVEVTVNGRPAEMNAAGRFRAPIYLAVGANPVTVSAMDPYENRAAKSFTIHREGAVLAPAAEKPPEAVAGRYHALIIGNNEYLHLPKLKTAVRDARDVAQILKDRYGFQSALLVDAKREDIVRALNEYRKLLRPEDSLFIYYAGHGQFDTAANKAYWLPVDARTDDDTDWIIVDRITSNVRRMACRHILIVADSCYSGTLARSAAIDMGATRERDQYLAKMRAKTSRTLMASGGNEPVSDEGGGKNSVFARALLDALARMDGPVFTAEELFHRHIRERVAGNAAQTPEYNILRNSGHDGGDFVFSRRN